MLPILMTLLPIFSISRFFADELFHQLLLWLILPTSFTALFIGCRKHRKGLIFITGLAGILLLVIVAALGHEILGENGEKILTSVAGIILAFSHYLNYRACQEITCSSKDCATQHHH